MTSPDTTTPPRRPTADDIELLGAAQSLELTARDLYRAAVSAGVGGDHLASLACMATHHDMASQSISAVIGGDAPQTRNDDLFDSLESGFTGDDVALTAHGLENSLVATHRFLLGELDGTEGSALIASILITEARHSAALASVAGLSPVDDSDAFLTTPSDTEVLA
ncbi:MAG: ferritin-like domain-containing protein [Ilumatobacteraceae bacterium]